MDQKTKRAADGQLVRTQKLEARLLAPRKPGLASQVGHALEEKLPNAAVDLLRGAFEKGFAVVFEKGVGVIERASGAEKHRGAYTVNRFTLEQQPGKRGLRRFDRRAAGATRGNQAITVAEGGLLGVLGIGLPDVPVFLGMLLKSVYEVALSYGFAYESDAERAYVLSVICAAVAQGADRQAAFAVCDQIGYAIDANTGDPPDCAAWVKRTANALADRLVLVKSVQGIPLIGAVGGIANGVLLGQVGKVAQIKYKKRFLYEIKRD